MTEVADRPSDITFGTADGGQPAVDDGGGHVADTGVQLDRGQVIGLGGALIAADTG